MRQKYTILKDDNTGALTIQEHAELSKDLFSLVCEESYDAETVQNAIGESKKALVDTLRTPNMYPISEYIEQIADKVMEIYDAKSPSPEAGPFELVFDDVDLFKKGDVPEEPLSEESVEIEDLLEDDAEEEILGSTSGEPANSAMDIPIDTSDDESHESPDDTDSLS